MSKDKETTTVTEAPARPAQSAPTKETVTETPAKETTTVTEKEVEK